MNPWPLVPFGELLQLREPDARVVPSETYQFAGVFSFGRGVFRGQIRRGAEFAYDRLTKLRAGEFVYPKLMAWEGAFGVVPPTCEGCYVSPEFPVFDICASRVLPRFLELYFQNPRTWRAISGVSIGTNVRRRRLHPNELLTRRMSLPPLEEQQRVVAEVDELAAKLEAMKGDKREALTAAQALWQAAASKLFARIAETSPARELGQLVAVHGGGTPSKTNPSYWTGSIPWVTPKDMKVRRIYDSIGHISEIATKETPAKLIRPGAVLVVVRGMILAHTVPSTVLKVAATINQDMKALVSNGDVTPEYLCSFLWATNRSLLARVEKSTHDTRKLDTATLLKIKVPVPSIGQQQRIAAELDGLEDRVNVLTSLQRAALAHLDALLPAVLNKVFPTP